VKFVRDEITKQDERIGNQALKRLLVDDWITMFHVISRVANSLKALPVGYDSGASPAPRGFISATQIVVLKIECLLCCQPMTGTRLLR
jgi:hypothetical protein